MTVNLKLLRGHVEGPHGWASRPYLCYKDALARHQAEHDAGGGRAGSVTRNQHTHGDDPTIPFGVWGDGRQGRRPWVAWGMSESEWNGLYYRQDGKCANCGKYPEWPNRPGRPDLFLHHVHDLPWQAQHKSSDKGCSRCAQAFVCQGCNVRLGNAPITNRARP